MLFAIFRLLDKDGSGLIDKQEFKIGIDLLNRRLAEDAQFRDHEELFQALDVDGSGEISMKEFDKLFSFNRQKGFSSRMYDSSKSLSSFQ
jgi:Ca2+-binding EF-hand superfamily protein